jgi:hypothetical protein
MVEGRSLGSASWVVTLGVGGDECSSFWGVQCCVGDSRVEKIRADFSGVYRGSSTKQSIYRGTSYLQPCSCSF